MADENLLQLTADIVAAHVANNNVPAGDVPTLIQNVFTALDRIGQPAPSAPEKPTPAVSIRASVKPDYLVCLEDGKRLKMLRRYLDRVYGMSPEQYRAKWGLPADYPMVAPNYAETRSMLAKSIGFGRKKAVEKVAKAAPTAKRGARKAVESTAAAPAAPAAKPARKKLGIAAAKAAAATHLSGK